MESMMQTKTMHLVFNDEGWPRVGTGWRHVEVQRGRRWAYVKEVGTTARRKKIFRKVLDAIVAQTAARVARDTGAKLVRGKRGAK
jgi:hypothetical protein